MKEHEYIENINHKQDKTDFHEHTRVFLFLHNVKGDVKMSRNHNNLTLHAQRFSGEMARLVKESRTTYIVNGQAITRRFTYMVHRNLPKANLNNPIGAMGDFLTVQAASQVIIMGLLNSPDLAELFLPHH